MFSPQITLIGRTNVGKSTIFNKLTENKGAIVSKIPGTTRDYKSGECLWLGQTFNLIDTAGLDVSTEKKIDQAAVEQAKKIAENSDLILFVVDAKDGLLPQDKEYAKIIKKLNKPFLLVANKVDSQRQINELAEFLKLGLGQAIAISAVTGAGTGDLLDEILQKVKSKLKSKKLIARSPAYKIAIVGKPNVGKSSLLNKIVGQERVIVSSLPHTTRDSQDVSLAVEFDGQKHNLVFIDTAGMIKRRKIQKAIDKFSIDQSLVSIKRADLVFLVIDATQPITQQDKNISREILEQSKSLIIMVNKWDLIEDKTTKSDKEFSLFIHRSFPYLTWAPIIFTSAKTGANINKIIKQIFQIRQKQQLKITDKQLERFLKQIIKKQAPRKIKGTKPPYIYTIKQVKTNPQTFEIAADQPKNIHFSYRRFITNQLREKFKLEGVGIKLVTVLWKKS